MSSYFKQKPLGILRAGICNLNLEEKILFHIDLS